MVFRGRWAGPEERLYPETKLGWGWGERRKVNRRLRGPGGGTLQKGREGLAGNWKPSGGPCFFR